MLYFLFIIFLENLCISIWVCIVYLQNKSLVKQNKYVSWCRLTRMPLPHFQPWLEALWGFSHTNRLQNGLFCGSCRISRVSRLCSGIPGLYRVAQLSLDHILSGLWLKLALVFGCMLPVDMLFKYMCVYVHLVAKALDLWFGGCEIELRLLRCRVTTLGKLITPMCLCHQAV